jgi:general secretion pathway protein N
LYASIAALSVAMSVLAFAPATWLGQFLEMQSTGRLALIDADGSLWHGSALLGAASSTDGAVTPLLPGRFAWQLSPWLLLIGRIDLQLANPQSLSQPVHLSGSWQQWHVGAASVLLPAERLAILGAPLNTLAPSGRMRLVWNDLNINVNDDALQLHGVTTLELDDMGSRLSPVNPLGSYRMRMTWQGTQAPLTLTSVRGPLLLQGSGTIHNGRLQFSGSAEAASGQEEKLANLLNLLGQRRQQDGRNIIALEFK